MAAEMITLANLIHPDLFNTGTTIQVPPILSRLAASGSTLGTSEDNRKWLSSALMYLDRTRDPYVLERILMGVDPPLLFHPRIPLDSRNEPYSLSFLDKRRIKVTSGKSVPFITDGMTFSDVKKDRGFTAIEQGSVDWTDDRFRQGRNPQVQALISELTGTSGASVAPDADVVGGSNEMHLSIMGNATFADYGLLREYPMSQCIQSQFVFSSGLAFFNVNKVGNKIVLSGDVNFIRRLWGLPLVKQEPIVIKNETYRISSSFCLSSSVLCSTLWIAVQAGIDALASYDADLAPGNFRSVQDVGITKKCFSTPDSIKDWLLWAITSGANLTEWLYQPTLSISNFVESANMPQLSGKNVQTALGAFPCNPSAVNGFDGKSDVLDDDIVPFAQRSRRAAGSSQFLLSTMTDVCQRYARRPTSRGGVTTMCSGIINSLSNSHSAWFKENLRRERITALCLDSFGQLALKLDYIILDSAARQYGRAYQFELPGRWALSARYGILYPRAAWQNLGSEIDTNTSYSEQLRGSNISKNPVDRSILKQCFGVSEYSFSGPPGAFAVNRKLPSLTPDFDRNLKLFNSGNANCLRHLLSLGGEVAFFSIWGAKAIFVRHDGIDSPTVLMSKLMTYFSALEELKGGAFYQMGSVPNSGAGPGMDIFSLGRNNPLSNLVATGRFLVNESTGQTLLYEEYSAIVEQRKTLDISAPESISVINPLVIGSGQITGSSEFYAVDVGSTISFELGSSLFSFKI